MATVWQTARGTFQKSGPYNNVAMGGTPNDTMDGLPEVEMNNARAHGLGKGIGFTPVGTDGSIVNIQLSLIGYAIDSNTRWLGNGNYVQYGGTYDWYLDVYSSIDGGRTYQPIESNILLAKHPDTQSLAFGSYWDRSTIVWNKNFTNIPEAFTHIKTEIRGANPGERFQNVYERKIIIPDSIVTVKHIDNATGNTIKGDDIYKVPYDTDFSIHFNSIGNYVPIAPEYTMRVKQNTNIIIKYNLHEDLKDVTVTVNFVEKGKYNIHTSLKYTYKYGTPVVVTSTLPDDLYSYSNDNDKRIDLGSVTSDKTIWIYMIPKKIYPWGVRLSDEWKSQTTTSNHFFLRLSKDNIMQRFGSDIFKAFAGKEGKFDSKIRIEDKWVIQGKMGD